MSEISIKDQVKKLVKLQKIDGKIYNFKKELEVKPAFIEELKEQFELKKETLKNLEEKFKNIQLHRKQKELDLQGKEDEITKSNTQLSQIKTNKEYTAKITEIESIKADKSIIEEDILLSYDEADAASVEIEKEKQNVDQEEKNYLNKKKEVEYYVVEIKSKVSELEAEKEVIVPEIDKDSLLRYERILRHKEGLAVVSVNGQVCGGCYMNLKPQTINEVKIADTIVECDMCSRILYFEDQD
ncbi:MAG: C4-type zinc ribbon domain-containing protein [Candidatus Zapsychrus exili]|nr:C4-type zinc ribbon domain-containing protein [Candidatus Zapsychrus exili]